MKKTIILMLIIMVAAVFTATAKDHEAGRKVWKKNCRTACHDGKTPGSPVLSPDSKTQMQWKNSFADDMEYIIKFHKEGELPELSPEDWSLISEFVYHHAHDSNNPEDCMGNAGALVR